MPVQLIFTALSIVHGIIQTVAPVVSEYFSSKNRGTENIMMNCFSIFDRSQNLRQRRKVLTVPFLSVSKTPLSVPKISWNRRASPIERRFDVRMTSRNSSH